ncbi:MAG TPA: thiamine-phosphate synthase family protein [Nitrososphaerales archaeon]|nr:thiamine-phosphate synthase family protein [Nitrososphaerales archaeon]
MQPPDELMADLYLPAMRQLVALELSSRGLSQGKISVLLGITQPSVSLYLSAPRAKAYATLSRLNVSREQADRAASDLAGRVPKGGMESLPVLMDGWRRVLSSGGACQVHRETYPSLADCDYCIVEYSERGGEEVSAIEEVSKAVRQLERSEEFVSIMPEVSVNIAYAPGLASAPNEVVAIPGRIVKAKGRARAMLPPEAGASLHMSRMLLLAKKEDADKKACLNVAYDSKMKRAIWRAGLKTLVVDGAGRIDAPDPTVSALQDKTASGDSAFDVVVEPGGPGLEPNAYLYGSGPAAVAEIALRLARSYLAGE